MKPNPNKLHYRVTACSEIKLNKAEQLFWQIPLGLELLHDVQKLIVYAWVVCKADFDLVQIWQGIFNLCTKKGEKEKEMWMQHNAWSDTTEPEKMLMDYNKKDLWNDTSALKK